MPLSTQSSDAEIVAFYEADREIEAHVKGRDRPALLREHVVAAAVTQCGAKTVLDVGCGDGHLARLLADLGLVVSFRDCNVEAVEETLRRLTSCWWCPKDRSRVGLIEELKEVAAYDAVTCCETIEHVRDPRSAFTRLWAATRDVVVLTTPVGHCYDDPGHLHHWDTAADLVNALGLRELTERCLVQSIQSQWGDEGLVFVLIARKEQP